MADSSKVEVPKGILTSLVLALLVALLALTFILGRMSVTIPEPKATPTAALVVAAPVPATVSPEKGSSSSVLITTSKPPTRRPVVREQPAVSEQTVVEESPSLPEPSEVPAAHPTRRPPATASSPRESVALSPKEPPRVHNVEVVNYLRQVDGLLSGTGDMGDPTEFATTMLGQAAQGDTSGFDDLLSKLRDARSRLTKIHPPEPCKEHYRLLDAQMRGSQTLLEALKKSMVTMDTSSLTGLAAQGQTMQTQAKRLETLTAQLKSRYH